MQFPSTCIWIYFRNSHQGAPFSNLSHLVLRVVTPGLCPEVGKVKSLQPWKQPNKNKQPHVTQKHFIVITSVKKKSGTHNNSSLIYIYMFKPLDIQATTYRMYIQKNDHLQTDLWERCQYLRCSLLTVSFMKASKALCIAPTISYMQFPYISTRSLFLCTCLFPETKAHMKTVLKETFFQWKNLCKV